MKQVESTWWQIVRQFRLPGTLRFTALTIIASTLAALILCDRVDVKIGDWLLTNWKTATETQNDIVIVAVDEQTLATLPYRSPVDRSFLAGLIQHIANGAPKAVGIDILFDQASEPDKDEHLLQTLRTSRVPVVMAFATTADGLTPRQAKYLAQTLTGFKKGHVALSRDAFDGTVRHWASSREHQLSTPLFASAVASAAGAAQTTASRRITYYSDADSRPVAFPTYPAHAARLLPPEWFKDKIVLIGATLPNVDQHQTPFTTSAGIEAGAIYGVKIHAHMIAQLLRNDSILDLGLAAKVLICLMVAGLVALALSSINSLPQRLLFIALVLGGLIVLLLATYNLLALELPVATLLTTALLTSSSFIVRDWHTDWAERRFIQQAFAQYVSPALVDKIAANHDVLKLGGEQRNVTYIFTDLEGFTSLSESLPPVRMSAILNEYLDGMCDLFIAHGATIDKIIGDAVVGLYGAPEEQPNHGDQAVRLALAIDAFAEQFRQSKSDADIPLGVTRIGLHHGPAVVGNFGGSRFFDYTAIGDTVNTAARLEGANKYFGTRVCVSRSVADAAKTHVFRSIGDVVLKGKDDPVTCLEPLEKAGDRAAYRKQYQAAFDCLSSNPEEAARLLHDLQQKNPGDGLVKFHLARIEAGEFGHRIELDNK